MEPILRVQIKELNLEDAVTLTGFVTNEALLDYYAAC